MTGPTNLEDYADPLIYDAENANNAEFKTDGPFYLYLAQQVKGPVLELGCGTGRIARLLARHGIEVTGMMLAECCDHLRRIVGTIDLAQRFPDEGGDRLSVLWPKCSDVYAHLFGTSSRHV